jgi:hypothetical protein
MKHALSRLSLLAGLLSLGMACSPSRSVPPVVTPPRTPDPVSVEPSPERRITLLVKPDTILYELTQVARFRPLGSDTVSIVHTRAILSLFIAKQDDSSYEATVSVDSLQVHNEGGSQRPILGRPALLGVILRGQLTAAGQLIQHTLPDSLCTYGHLVAVAEELFTPRLGISVEVRGTETWTDTLHSSVCRTGSRVSVQTIRETRSSLNGGLTLQSQGRSVLDGRGLLRRDSVVITGDLSVESTTSFREARFPISVTTQSEGNITIRLADSTAVFRQTVGHQLQRRDD